MRGVTQPRERLCRPCEFLLTRLMRGVTLTAEEMHRLHVISTHTPHARRDFHLFVKAVA